MRPRRIAALMERLTMHRAAKQPCDQRSEHGASEAEKKYPRTGPNTGPGMNVCTLEKRYVLRIKDDCNPLG